MTRDRATIAVVMFDGAPMFEMSVPIRVFGVDRTANGAPRFNLLSVHGDPGVLTTTGGIQLKVPNGLEALQHAGIVIVPSWRNSGELPPEPMHSPTISAPSSWLPLGCSTADAQRPTGITPRSSQP